LSGWRAPSADPVVLAQQGATLPDFYDDAELTISDGASLVYFPDGTLHTYTLTSAFAMVVPVDTPDNAGRSDLQFEGGTSLALVGGGLLTVRMAEPRDAVLAFNDENVTVHVWQDRRPVANYTGRDWVFRLEGGGRLRLEAESILIPFGKDAVAHLRPGPPPLAQERFDLTRIDEAFRRAAPNANTSAPPLDPAVAQQFRDAAPIFNGVLLGNPRGNATIGELERTMGRFTMIRFQELTLRPGSERGDVLYAGTGAFVLVGDNLHTTRSAVATNVFPIPVLGLVVWILAGGAMALATFAKPFAPAHPANAAAPIRRVALATHLSALLVVLYLWDLETRVFLGTSFLSMLVGTETARGLAFSAVLGVQLLTLGLAWTFFGLPIRFLANAALKLGALRRARGVGRGLGWIAAWGLGATSYALLLNPFIGLFVDSLGRLP
jgi:hypothetical protein